MKRINKKVILLAVSLVLILSVAIGGTVAYLIDQTDSITNTFTPASVPPHIDENFNGSVKDNVQIRNDGDIPAYIRVKVVVTWKDTADNVYGETPAFGTDYTWTMPESSKWFLKDGSRGLQPVRRHSRSVHSGRADYGCDFRVEGDG